MNRYLGPVVTLSLFRFDTVANKFWAFTGMQLSHRHLSNAEGLSTYKLMGSGSNGGFHLYPNFGVYGFLGVWKDPNSAEKFFSENPKIIEYQSKALNHIRFYLKPLSAHGSWSGSVPFEASSEIPNGPVAVLTRARIRTRRLSEFWSNVGRTAEAIANAHGCHFSIGVGEWPLIEQATFSIWANIDSVREYAYKGKIHSRVVEKTRKRDWYSEEFFARLSVVRMEGEWPGFSASVLQQPT
jgi:hypothetical protein